MTLKLSPYRFLTSVAAQSTPESTQRMATVLLVTPSVLRIQFDGEDTVYEDALAGAWPLAAGQRVIVTRISGRWIITHVITNRYDFPPTFATTGERDGVLGSNPADGILCYVTAQNALYLRQSGVWVHASPTTKTRTSVLQVVSNNTSYVQDTFLTIPMEPASKYEFEYWLLGGSTVKAPDIGIEVYYPNDGAIAAFGFMGPNVNSTIVTGADLMNVMGHANVGGGGSGNGAQFALVSNSSLSNIRINGVVTSVGAGNFGYQITQVTNSGTNATINIGSSLRYRKVG